MVRDPYAVDARGAHLGSLSPFPQRGGTSTRCWRMYGSGLGGEECRPGRREEQKPCVGRSVSQVEKAGLAGQRLLGRVEAGLWQGPELRAGRWIPFGGTEARLLPYVALVMGEGS